MGVARFDPQKKVFKPYSTADGLPGPDLTGWRACFKSVRVKCFLGIQRSDCVFPEMYRIVCTPPDRPDRFQIGLNRRGRSSWFTVKTNHQLYEFNHPLT